MPNSDHCFGYLCDNGAGSGTLVSPGGREDTHGLVVAGETVDAGLDENEAEFRILVLSVSLKVLADSDGLQIFISMAPSIRRVETRTFLINM